MLQDAAGVGVSVSVGVYLLSILRRISFRVDPPDPSALLVVLPAFGRTSHQKRRRRGPSAVASAPDESRRWRGGLRCVSRGRRLQPLRDKAGIAEQNARKAGSELPFCECLPAEIVRHLSLVNCCSRRAPQRQASQKIKKSSQPQTRQRRDHGPLRPPRPEWSGSFTR